MTEKMKLKPRSREAFNPSTKETTLDLSIYLTLLKFMTTRGVRFSRTSRKRALRTSGEFARSMSPEISKIVALSTWRAEICTMFLLDSQQFKPDFMGLKYLTNRN